MSLEVVRAVHAAFPEYAGRNTGEMCHWFTRKVIERLQANRHLAYHICKSPGEGQYIPFGFVSRPVTGLDGKTYVCSGVSHDAIWCDGKQFDILASANEHEHPIYRKTTEPFWSFDPADGSHIVATPVWNEIPPGDWRDNNPPLRDAITLQPAPPPATKPYPGDAFFVEKLGVPLEADMALAGHTLNAGSSVWFSRTIWRHVNEGMSMDESAAQSRKEWRAILGLPPL